MNNQTFVFEKYQVTDNQLEFYYSYKDGDRNEIAHFCEKYKLPIAINADDRTTQYILQQLHIIVGVSYYKSLLGNIELPYELNASEADYWNIVYGEGLGEFMYVNKLTAPIQPFISTSSSANAPLSLQTTGAILGIGGGKDSIVSGELFKRLGIETTTMDVATGDNHGQAGSVMDMMGLPQLRIERYLDTDIVDFTNKYSGYHGHIPFSVILAWFGVLLAYTQNNRYVIMANEASTSVGNTEWNGKPVNHQWAKSARFEKLIKQFIYSHISPDIHYFSPIRPYSSLAVISLFVKWGTMYFDTFTSCNFVLRIDPSARPNGRWCTKCAKCLSTWLLLSVWLDESQLEHIFGRNMFRDISLQPALRELLALQGHKPLNCVGTSEELRAATRKALETSVDRPLLDGLRTDQIPGPELEELIRSVGPHDIPDETAPNLLALIMSELK